MSQDMTVGQKASQKAIAEVKAYIDAQRQKTLLRFITCGSVDDGKSTLIGRLLFESKLLFDDQLENLKNVSKKLGTQGDDIDFALLVDGLAAEREQGITIDVAYRFFNTEQRKFIVIDTPGHEQYTRNMATGASQADLAVLMVDARQGLTTQTKRHAYIVQALGVKHIVVAINKMDLVDYGQDRFDELVENFRTFSQKIDMEAFTAIPMSALKGDNVLEASGHMDWYTGPTLMQHLNTVSVADEVAEKPFRMPVQWVNRPDLDFRGFAGRVVSGSLKVGDKITSMPSGKTSKLARVYTVDGDLDEVLAGQSVTLCLEDEIDASRGDILCAGDANLPQQSDNFHVKILWMSEQKLRVGRTFRMKIGAHTVNASVTQTKHVIDVNTLQHISAETLELNEIGECIVRTERPICFEPYANNREMGGFILIDKITNATMAMGLIADAHSGADLDQRTQELTIDRAARADQKRQVPLTVWFTGLKRSGKTYIANALERKLFARGCHSFILDPGNVLPGMSEDLDFESSDQIENVRRVAHMSKLMNDAGLIVMTCFTSPLSFERRMARRIIGTENFLEIHMDTPIEISLAQDSQGYFEKARRGEIKNVAGIDMRFEPPKAADLTFSLRKHSPEDAADIILAKLTEMGVLGG
ncbi:MAG: sulfate adenylyltransferase subunit CysN [Robiginitomaculum sp.]|nr:sulfate adenylyltransferase subunit CysN [Robiginitomaculum sp.]